VPPRLVYSVSPIPTTQGRRPPLISGKLRCDESETQNACSVW
jgi:hypothetical protein